MAEKADPTSIDSPEPTPPVWRIEREEVPLSRGESRNILAKIFGKRKKRQGQLKYSPPLAEPHLAAVSQISHLTTHQLNSPPLAGQQLDSVTQHLTPHRRRDELPPGWEKKHAYPGGLFYINTIDGKSEKHRPTPDQIKLAQQYQSQRGRQLREEIETRPHTSGEDKLPPEWERSQTPTGQVYYINKIEGYTQQHPPTPDQVIEARQEEISIREEEISILEMVSWSNHKSRSRGCSCPQTRL